MDGQIEAGRALLQAGNAPAAIRNAKDALSRDANDTDAYDLLVDALVSDGDEVEAKRVLRTWLAVDPHDPRALFMELRMTLRWPSQRDDAGRMVEEMKASPRMDPAIKVAAEALLEMYEGHPAKAATLLETVIERSPDAGEFRLFAARAQLEARNPFRAIEHLEYLVTQNPNHAEALNLLAYCRYRAFRFSDALGMSRAAQSIAPGQHLPRWMKWLVPATFFPLFLLGHTLAWIMAKLAELAGGMAGHIAAGSMAAAIAGAFFWARSGPMIRSELWEAAVMEGWPVPPVYAVSIAIAMIALAWGLFVHYGVLHFDDETEGRRIAPPAGY